VRDGLHPRGLASGWQAGRLWPFFASSRRRTGYRVSWLCRVR